MDNLFELPPLPPIDLFDGVCLDKDERYSGTEDGYTTDKMLAYARAAVEAEREACARLCDPRNPPHDWTTYAKTRAECASAIRKRGKS